MKDMIDKEKEPSAVRTDVAVTLMARDYKGVNNYGTNGAVSKSCRGHRREEE